MKSTWIKSVVLVLIPMLVCGSLWAKDKKENETLLLIETHKKIVKGFPFILRINTVGLRQVPKMSLFDELAFVNIVFVSKEDGTKYTISPPRQGYDMMFLGPSGEASGHIPRQFYETSLKPNEKRTKLLDITSLVSHGKGMILAGIPSGKYVVSMRFSSTGKTSNKINVEIMKPSKEEEKYLKNIWEGDKFLRRKKEIVWSQLLLKGASIPEKNFSKLSIDAQSQLRFHIMLSKAVRRAKLIDKVGSAEGLQESIRKTIDSSKVQDFLHLEKECLKLQLFGDSDKKKAFIRQYPGLAWRLNKLQQEDRGFLSHLKNFQ